MSLSRKVTAFRGKKAGSKNCWSFTCPHRKIHKFSAHKSHRHSLRFKKNIEQNKLWKVSANQTNILYCTIPNDLNMEIYRISYGFAIGVFSSRRTSMHLNAEHKMSLKYHQHKKNRRLFTIIHTFNGRAEKNIRNFLNLSNIVLFLSH